MTERTRSHVLEDESFVAFRQALPSDWVVRPITQDYGIDFEIEIFIDGQATGLTFKAQVKATDQKPTKRSLKMDSWRYWRRLDVPVLVVLYHSQSDRLYSRWAHAHDPRNYPKPTPKKSTTFKFTDSEILTSDNAISLQKDVITFRNLRTGRLPRPMPIFLESVEHGGLDADSLRQSLKEEVGKTRGILSVSLRKDGAIYVRIAPDAISVYLPGDYLGSTQHDIDKFPEPLPASAIAQQLVSMIAQQFSQIHRESEAAQLLRCVGAAPLHLLDIEVTMDLIEALLHEGDVITCLKIGLQLDDMGLGFISEVVEMWLAASMSRPGLPRREMKNLLARHTARAKSYLEAGQKSEAGQTYFNAAMVASRLDDHLESIELLQKAASVKPQYNTWSYFHRELGASYFMTANYAASLKAYKDACHKTDDRGLQLEFIAKAIDAGLYAGNYEAATNLLESVNTQERESWPLMHVLSRIVPLVRRVCDLPQQNRPVDNVRRPDLSSTKKVRRYLRTVDALDLDAWMQLGMSGYIDNQDIVDVFLLGGHFERVPVLFVMALALAIETDLTETLQHSILEMALRYHKLEELVASGDEASRRLGGLNVNLALAAFRVADDEAAETLSFADKGLSLRIHDAESGEPISVVAFV